MHKDLLGYLLGALEPEEMRRMAEWVRQNPEAKRQLEKIEQALKPLDQIDDDSDDLDEAAGEDLIARTMASLPPLPPLADSDAMEQVWDAPQMPDQPGSLERTNALTPASLTDGRKSHRAGWMDWVAGSISAAVILGLLVPSLAEGRFEARKVACQENLRQFGTALIQYVSRGTQERLPAVHREGPEAFAGVYALRLAEAGLISSPETRWCPSVGAPVMRDNQQDAATTHLIPLPEESVAADTLVSLEQLQNASVNQLRDIQRYSGGHYAYNLGVIDHESYMSPKFESRSSFAVMADAPVMVMITGEISSEFIGHNGRGMNVLYEDGRVQFLNVESLDVLPDHPMMNHAGQREAGVHRDDASLAPSWRPPFADSPQR